MTYFRLLRKNLTRKKLRLFLTIFSIFTAFLIFGVLKTFDSSLNAGIELAGADRLITSSKVSLIQPLPFSHYTKIKATEGVKNVSHASWFGGYYQEPKNFIASFAIDAVETTARTYKYRAVIQNVPKFLALLIENKSGTALASAGNIVDISIHKYDSA